MSAITASESANIQDEVRYLMAMQSIRESEGLDREDLPPDHPRNDDYDPPDDCDADPLLDGGKPDKSG